MHVTAPLAAALTLMRLALQAVAFRRVLRDDSKGRLDAEVEQIGQWKFLCFSGSFATRLYVYQDKRRGTVRPAVQSALPALVPLPSRAEGAGLLQIDFKLAQPGLMKNFEGKWRVQPFTQATLDEVSGQHPAQSRPRWLPAAFDNLHFCAPLSHSELRTALSLLHTCCSHFQLCITAAASTHGNIAVA